MSLNAMGDAMQPDRRTGMKQASRFRGRWAMRAGKHYASMVKAIVALETATTRLAGKAKLSKNKEPREIRNARVALIAQGNQHF